MIYNLHYASLIDTSQSNYMTITHEYGKAGIALTDGIIEWGDGQKQTVSNESEPQLITHTYQSSGSHTITIRPNTMETPQLVKRYALSSNNYKLYMNPFACDVQEGSYADNNGNWYYNTYYYNNDKPKVVIGGDSFYPNSIIGSQRQQVSSSRYNSYVGVNDITISEGIKTIYGSSSGSTSDSTIYLDGANSKINSITLPSSLTSITGDYAIFASGVNAYNAYIHLLSTTPPTLSDQKAIYPMTGSYKLYVYVPKGSLSAYENAPIWSTYYTAGKILEETN